jgi:hypothetical protein
MPQRRWVSEMNVTYLYLIPGAGCPDLSTSANSSKVYCSNSAAKVFDSCSNISFSSSVISSTAFGTISPSRRTWGWRKKISWNMSSSLPKQYFLVGSSSAGCPVPFCFLAWGRPSDVLAFLLAGAGEADAFVGLRRRLLCRLESDSESEGSTATRRCKSQSVEVSET